jgi:protein gp37
MNIAVGCTKVSEGCRNCYAEALVGRLTGRFGHAFEDVQLHLDRLPRIRQMRPHVGPGGALTPYLCFVNSMSDFWHDAIPDKAIHEALDVFDQHPTTVLQILTKRPIRMRKLLAARYGGKGIPPHIWIGVSVESNEVAGRIDVLRKLKERVGTMTAFLSVEPIVGPTDKLDFAGADWVITGGESGPKARHMERAWLLDALGAAHKAGSAIWHKQSGTIRSHPNFREAPADLGVNAAFEWLVKNRWEWLPDEKGGATVDQEIYREFPVAYYDIANRLNANRLV